jgi:oligosaccharide repeat unit polymerase
MNQAIILGQCLLLWAIALAIGRYATRRDGRAPADDMGVFWLAILALYSTLPPLLWLAKGGYYDQFSNIRLFRLQPSPPEVISLLNLAIAYAVSFGVVYFLFRRRIPRFQPEAFPLISKSKLLAAVVVVGSFQLAMLVVYIGGFMQAQTSYLDSYRVVQEMPLVQRQLLKVGAGMALMATTVLVVGLLQRWGRGRKLIVAYVIFTILSFDPDGARTSVILPLLALVLTWHVVVRPIDTRRWIVGGIVGLLLFLALGLRRDVGSWSDLRYASIEVGEFDHLWANAVELLQQRQTSGLEIPGAARFAEFVAFIPSQILPFEKRTADTWFLETFYPGYREMGGGYVFGAISQAVIGGGILEAVIRGAALAWIAASLMRWCRRRTSQWWRLPLYQYLLILTYQSVRDTTFHVLTDVIQLAIPTLILLAALGTILTIAPPVDRAAVFGPRFGRPLPDGRSIGDMAGR